MVKIKLPKNDFSIKFYLKNIASLEDSISEMNVSKGQQLSVLETKLVHLIPRGMERTIKIKDLERLCGVKDREIQAAVSRMIKKGVPVCSVRGGADNSGYFIPTNKGELKIGIRAITSQVQEMNKRIELVSLADLENWESDLVKTYQEILDMEDED